jgi:hypothetical protein
MMDLYLSEHVETVEGFDVDGVSYRQGKASDWRIRTAQGSRDILLTDDGVSPRAIPGIEGNGVRCWEATSTTSLGTLSPTCTQGLDWAIDDEEADALKENEEDGHDAEE